MNGIEILLKDGKISVNSQFDYAPGLLSADEERAVNLIFQILDNAGIDLTRLSLERRTSNYLSIVLDNLHDFCRIKMGQKSKWVSISMVRIQKDFINDPRLSEVKNKNQFHWKIGVNCPDDLCHYSDIIQKSCISHLE